MCLPSIFKLMSTFSFGRYLPCFLSNFYPSVFPNAMSRGFHYLPTQQMTPKPYPRLHLPETNIRLPTDSTPLKFDEYCEKTCGNVRSNMTKWNSKTAGKSSDKIVMRRVRRSRTVFTNDQVAELENYFLKSNYVNTEKAEELAAKLFLNAAPVKYWFKNQRRRNKMKESKKSSKEALQKCKHKKSVKSNTEDHKNINVGIPCGAPHARLQLQEPPPVEIISDIRIPYPFTYNNHMIPNITAHQTGSNELISNQYDVCGNANNVPNATKIRSPKMTQDCHSSTRISNVSDTSDYFSQMSPNSDINEPPTPDSIPNESGSVFNDILDCLHTSKVQHSLQNIYENLITAPDLVALDRIPHSYEISKNNPSSLNPLCSHYLNLS